MVILRLLTHTPIVQAHLVGTGQEQLAETPVNNYTYIDYYNYYYY